DQAAADVGGSFQGLALGAAGAAVGATFMAGLTSAMDMKSAQAKLTAQMDLTAEEAEKAGDVAGEVYTAGFGESIGEVTDAVGSLAAQLGGVGKVGEEELTALTKQSMALAEVFEFDIGEATQAAGTLIKTGLAKDGAEAMDLLAATAQKLPPAMREELPTLTREYGEFFDQLGFTGPEMMGLLTEAAKNPTFELDKMGDALKEFTLLMADTDAVKEPLKELGLDVAEIQKLMNTGQGTEAFDMVTTALRGVEDQTKRTSLQAALFGGPGEDMGNSLLNLKATGADAASGLDKAAGAAEKITTTMEDSKELDAVWRELSTTLGELFLPYLVAFSDWVSENPELLQTIVIGMLTFATTLGIVAAAQWLWNSALLAWPGTWIIAAILAVIAIVVLIIVYWDEIKKVTLETWDAIVEALGEAWDWVKETAAETWQAIVDGVTDAWDWVKRVTTETWAAITKGLSDAWNWTKSTAAEIWNSIAKVFADGWNWMVRNVFSPIGHFFTVTIPGWVSAGVEGVKGLWNGLVDWFASIPGRLASIGSSLWGFITEGLKGALNGAIWLVNRGIEFINNLLIGNANRIPGVDIGYIPYIPYLAEGGVTTGPTLAMIGEGREQEAVLPLSVLDGMLQSVARPVVQVGSTPREQVLVLRIEGGEDEFVRFFKHVVDTKASGSVVRLGEG
ncbi:hypothetical protein ACFXHD_21485, partial [Streptomyces hydrogenans]|uniref:hypothetical protein n=1 Tax=Streptomyces hydrogenans TaxID=1873719 RepID=UPI0036B22110